jgi:hypothetical protein
MFNLKKYSQVKKRRLVARDSEGKIMWVRGRPDLSVMNYYEWREAKNMISGRVETKGIEFIPPYTIGEEEV